MRILNNHVATIVCALLLTAPAQVEQHSATPEKERLSSVFISDSRIKILKKRIAKRKPPTYPAFMALKKYADRNLNREPEAPDNWFVPRFYGPNREAHNKMMGKLIGDARSAYAQTLCFRITGQEKYAQSALRFINTWASRVEMKSVEEDSALGFSDSFSPMIFAADLLRHQGVWPNTEQDSFSEFLKNRAILMNTIDKENNWGNWGLLLTLSCAVYLKDESLFNECIERWKYFIENQIAPDGHLPAEVNRVDGKKGLSYSHFCLQPQTIAAEIIKVNGVDLFEYESPNGRTMKMAFRRVASWTKEPATFPYWKGKPEELNLGGHRCNYFEILNSRWPDASAREVLRELRPMSGSTVPFLTFTHGESLPKVEKTK